MSGVNLMASQIGGAIAPLLVVPIQMRYGWRMSFFVFGVAGLVWAAVWYAWFRDSPEEKRGLARRLRPPAVRRGAPIRASRGARPRGRSTVWAVLGLAFCYIYVYNFFQTWFHTFLVRGRGFSEATPAAVGAAVRRGRLFANLAGGAASDALVRRLGVTRGRRFIGATALAAAAVFTIAAMLTQHQVLTVVFLALTYGAITFQQSGVFGVCLDIGGPRAGAMVGLMNTVAQIGGLVGSVLYGYIVTRSGSYDAPFIPMAVVLCIGAALWLKVDASEKLGDGRAGLAPRSARVRRPVPCPEVRHVHRAVDEARSARGAVAAGAAVVVSRAQVGGHRHAVRPVLAPPVLLVVGGRRTGAGPDRSLHLALEDARLDPALGRMERRRGGQAGLNAWAMAQHLPAELDPSSLSVATSQCDNGGVLPVGGARSARMNAVA